MNTIFESNAICFSCKIDVKNTFSFENNNNNNEEVLVCGNCFESFCETCFKNSENSENCLACNSNILINLKTGRKADVYFFLKEIFNFNHTTDLPRSITVSFCNSRHSEIYKSYLLSLEETPNAEIQLRKLNDSSKIKLSIAPIEDYDSEAIKSFYNVKALESDDTESLDEYYKSQLDELIDEEADFEAEAVRIESELKKRSEESLKVNSEEEKEEENLEPAIAAEEDEEPVFNINNFNKDVFRSIDLKIKREEMQKTSEERNMKFKKDRMDLLLGKKAFRK